MHRVENKAVLHFLALSVFLLFLQGTFAKYERKCRNNIIDCGEQVILFKETPIARTLPVKCQNEAGCHNEVECQPTQNCTSVKLVKIFVDDCSCKSRCRVKELIGYERCYYFDVLYECVDKCSTWPMPVIIASSVGAMVLIVIVIIICIVRRRRKRRRKASSIGPEHLQRAYKMHQHRNEKPSTRNHNMSEIRQMNAGDLDAEGAHNELDGLNMLHARPGSPGRSIKPGNLTDCCSVNESVTSSGQRVSLDSQNSSNANTSGEYVTVQNDDLKIYVRNDDGKLTIPRTKLNKNAGNVLKRADLKELDYHDNTPSIEEDCGDYDNMMFGNCGDRESDQSEAHTSWQTNLNKSPEVLCDDVYDNVLYEEKQGHLVHGVGTQDLTAPMEFDDGTGTGNPEPQCHNLTNADFGLLYDNVEFSEGSGNIVDNGTEASHPGECELDYDNVDFNEGHGELAEVVEKGIVQLQSRSLPVIYEYDEGISMENDEYDYVDEGQGQAMTLKTDNVNNGANQEVNNENYHDIHLPVGQRQVLQGQDQGQGHADIENMVNKLILDQEEDSCRGNNNPDLYESLQHSSFQKPVDYGMKLNMLHQHADGRPRVRGQGHISSPVSEQPSFGGVIDNDVYPSSCDYSQSSIPDEDDYLEPIPYQRPTDNDLSQGQGAQGYFPPGNSNDNDIFQSDEYY